MLPRELHALLDQIDACERDAEALVADLDDDGVNRPPATGGWTIAQCLAHLTLMNEFYLRGCRERVAPARAAGAGAFAGLRPTAIGRWFVKSMEPPPRLRAKARPTVTPAARVPRDTLVPAYRASHQPYRDLVRASADVDVNHVIVPNPFFPSVRMRLSTILLVIPAHDRRHLWQAARVRAG